MNSRIWQAPQGMEEYLAVTELIDFKTRIVQEAAQKMLEGVQTPKDAALRMHRFVREIKYVLIPLETKASAVLKLNKSECVAKATLLIALLRAVNIPARYHFVSIRKELLKGLFSPLLYCFMAKVVPGHGWCEVYLGGRWIAIEALWDTELFEVFKQKGLNCLDFTGGQLEWNGEQDIALPKKWIVEDIGTYASADDYLKSNPMQLALVSTVLLPFGFYISNLHIEGMRKAYRQSKGYLQGKSAT